MDYSCYSFVDLMKSKRKKITVIYNKVTTSPSADKDAILTEQGEKEDAKKIAGVLESGGYRANLLELTPDALRSISKIKSDLFFNLCDGIGNIPKTEHKVPEYLDQMRLSYTGANASSLILTTNKVLTKKIFDQNRIPTPKFVVYETVPEEIPSKLDFPLFAKPVAEDCSLGITADSIVENMADLKRDVKRLLEKYHQPVLVEEYIPGRELNVTILGNGNKAVVLPISEISFGRFFLGKAKFVDFRAKWVENSLSYKHTVGVCPARLDGTLQKKIERLALLAYYSCGGRDYARIDIRLARDQTPYFLEVNLNCDISPEMGAFRSARVYGLSYSQFISRIAVAASERYE